MNEENVAWHCMECGRVEAPADQKHCPDCGTKMQRCSRYEWFLSDELEKALNLLGAKFTIIEQYPIPDHRGFNWYFDIYVWVEGHSYFRGYGEIIEVNGASHQSQKKYSGKGGGYTRDFDKHWEAFANYRLHKRGIEYRTVDNENCKRSNVHQTALEIADELVERSNSWC